MIALYKVFINAEYNNLTKHNCNERDHLLKSIGMLNDRLNKAHRKVFEEKLDPLDFKLMKGDCENEIGELERKLVSLQSDNPKSIEGFLEIGLNNLLRIQSL